MERGAPHAVTQEQQATGWIRRDVATRLASVVLALGTGTVLGLAAWLEPSPLGHSTHLQLGLGQCTFLTMTGYPCPMCGMTTTFALMAHFHPIRALFNQPFGVVLFVMTLGTFAVAVSEVVLPRGRWDRFLDRVAPWETILASGFLVAMGLGWIYKIVMMNSQ